MRPRLRVNGLSRSLGPVPTVDDVAAGTFDPDQVFAAMEDATLLGVIKLKRVLEKVTGASLSDGLAPRMTQMRHADRVETTFEWLPKNPSRQRPDCSG